MKIALVQDWFVVNGGAEKIVKELVTLYPNAEVFGLVDFLNDQDRKDVLNGKRAKTSFLQQLPFAAKGYRNFLPLFPKAIEGLDLSEFDLIISSSYSVAKGLKREKGKQLHICYCHSPIRYAWDLEREYLSHLSGLKKWIAKLTLAYIRKWDISTLDRVDFFIANSNFIAERIKRIYGRDAAVIYPPVDTSSFIPVLVKEEYYFTSARMVAYKKLDLIVKAFEELPHLKLVVSGDGPEFEKLKKMATPNVVFTGFLTKNDLVTKMQRAKAFILAAEEDFGITSLEAQACATPVIALRKGGYLETVLEGKTGCFFDEQNSKAITEAVVDFEQKNWNFKLEDFTNQVNRFSTVKFNQAISALIEEHVAKK